MKLLGQQHFIDRFSFAILESRSSKKMNKRKSTPNMVS